MDYIYAFQNLKTNNKYERKSPHKAILLLSVMELIEKGSITSNEIVYNDELLSTFQNIWNKVLPQEATFYTTVYFPFWHLQSEEFWHVIPRRGKETAFQTQWETRTKPTEARVVELIKCVVLDDDLYFQMTLPSGRSSLRRILLETYTSLSPRQVDKYAKSEDIVVDNSTEAMKEYQSILESASHGSTNMTESASSTAETHFLELNDDMQVALCAEYYAFLRKHPYDRDIFRELCPTVYDLYERIKYAQYQHEELPYSYSSLFETFLGDLRISLMSETGSVQVIDDITEALDKLQGITIAPQATPESGYEESIVPDFLPIVTQDDAPAKERETTDSHFDTLKTTLHSNEARHGQPWTKEEEEFLVLCHEKGWTSTRIAEELGRSEKSVDMRLDRILNNSKEAINVPSSSVSSVPVETEFPAYLKVVNASDKCAIYDLDHQCVYSDKGSIKVIRGKAYRINYKVGFFTVKSIIKRGGKWRKGESVLVANGSSDLYRYMDHYDCSLADIEDLLERPETGDVRFLFANIWYDKNGMRL